MLFSDFLQAVLTCSECRSIGTFTGRAALVEWFSGRCTGYFRHFMADTIPLDYIEWSSVEPVEYVANF